MSLTRSCFEAGAFFPDDASLAAESAPALLAAHAATLRTARISLVAGEFFAPDMAALADALGSHGIPCTHHTDVAYPHRWDAGWLSAHLPTVLASLP